MTARDARGRFISDDEAAATRVLEAAVARAVLMLRERHNFPRYVIGASPTVTMNLSPGAIFVVPDEADRIVAILRNAAESADLLLRRAS